MIAIAVTLKQWNRLKSKEVPNIPFITLKNVLKGSQTKKIPKKGKKTSKRRQALGNNTYLCAIVTTIITF